MKRSIYAGIDRYVMFIGICSSYVYMMVRFHRGLALDALYCRVMCSPSCWPQANWWMRRPETQLSSVSVRHPAGVIARLAIMFLAQCSAESDQYSYQSVWRGGGGGGCILYCVYLGCQWKVDTRAKILSSLLRKTPESNFVSKRLDRGHAHLSNARTRKN